MNDDAYDLYAPRNVPPFSINVKLAPTRQGDEVPLAQLRQSIERIERLEEEQDTLNEDMNETLGEARGRAATALRRRGAEMIRDVASLMTWNEISQAVCRQHRKRQLGRSGCSNREVKAA